MSTPQILEVWYRNYRGEVDFRRIIPKGIVFGSTEWHPESQWLLHAFDEDKQAYRYFAMKDFVSPPSDDRVVSPTASTSAMSEDGK